MHLSIKTYYVPHQYSSTTTIFIAISPENDPQCMSMYEKSRSKKHAFLMKYSGTTVIRTLSLPSQIVRIGDASGCRKCVFFSSKSRGTYCI